MKGVNYWFVIALQVLSWVSATSRNFDPRNDLDVHKAGSAPNPHRSSSQVTLQQDLASSNGVEANVNDITSFRGGNQIGSSPPSCEKKCYGCTPCEAIQVPTTTSKKLNHFRVQYANYEPEGWKCNCGLSFFLLSLRLKSML